MQEKSFAWECSVSYWQNIVFYEKTTVFYLRLRGKFWQGRLGRYIEKEEEQKTDSDTEQLVTFSLKQRIKIYQIFLWSSDLFHKFIIFFQLGSANLPAVSCLLALHNFIKLG